MRSLLLALVLAAGPLSAAEEAGVVTGILTAKSASWIDVKADGEKDAKRYMPIWRGGQDGGFDKATVEAIGKLVVSNRVKLEWKFEEHLRIVSVAMIVPAEKAGTVTGVVTAKGDAWLEVDADGDAPTDRYLPRWIGGAPKDGGGLDKDLLAAIAKLKVGTRVELKWQYDERLRAVEVKELPAES